MSKSWQIYYNTVFGAIGGLVGWLLVGQVPTSTWNVHVANMFIGAGVGLFIGGALGMVDGMLVKRSFLRTMTGLIGGGVAGLLSGMVGLLLGGVAFLLIQGGLVARMIGWMALGLFLGLGQGVISLKFKRATYGLVGGALAGLVGGALYEIFTQTFLQQSGQAQVFLSALGLVLIGMSLGSIIPLTIGVLGDVLAVRGVVVVLNGRRANMEVEVIGSAKLGSSDACDVYVPDEQVDREQGLIRKGQSGFELMNIGRGSTIYVNQKPLPLGQMILLRNDDQLQVGTTLLKFRAK